MTNASDPSKPPSTAAAALRSRLLSAAALVFLLPPLFVWVASYDPSDCDDKAVHFFSAMDFRASAAEREAFHEAIAPFVAASSADSWWPRNEFRLKSTRAYPLANVTIAALHRPDARFVDTVKWSLLLVTALAMAVVVAVAAATPLGAWPAVVALNLVAWQLTPIHRLFALVPVNMVPFLSFVPRGAGSLLVIPVVLAFAARRWRLLAACVVAVFAWHLGLGLILLGVTLPALALCWLLLREVEDFHDRALVAALAVLAVAVLVSKATDLPRVDAVVQSLMGMPAARQTSLRLLASETSLLALLMVLAARRVALAAAQLLPPAMRVLPGSASRLAMAALLATLALSHAQTFEAVAAGRGGFLEPTCVHAVSVPLPAQWRRLNLRDEPSLFLSFADTLLALREGRATDAAASVGAAKDRAANDGPQGDGSASGGTANDGSGSSPAAAVALPPAH